MNGHLAFGVNNVIPNETKTDFTKSFIFTAFRFYLEGFYSGSVNEWFTAWVFSAPGTRMAGCNWNLLPCAVIFPGVIACG